MFISAHCRDNGNMTKDVVEDDDAINYPSKAVQFCKSSYYAPVLISEIDDKPYCALRYLKHLKGVMKIVRS